MRVKALSETSLRFDRKVSSEKPCKDFIISNARAFFAVMRLWYKMRMRIMEW